MAMEQAVWTGESVTKYYQQRSAWGQTGSLSKNEFNHQQNSVSLVYLRLSKRVLVVGLPKSTLTDHYQIRSSVTLHMEEVLRP